MDEKFEQLSFDDLPSDAEIAEKARQQIEVHPDPYASQTKRSEEIVALRGEDLAAEQTGGWRREVDPINPDTNSIVITDDPELNAEWHRRNDRNTPSVPTEGLTSEQKNANERAWIAEQRRKMR